MNKSAQTNLPNAETSRKLEEVKPEAEAKKEGKNLEAKKQALKDTLLLTKGTSGNSGASEERIEFLEKKLEEVTQEARKATNWKEAKCWGQRYF